jgi:hypothetical protein
LCGAIVDGKEKSDEAAKKKQRNEMKGKVNLCCVKQCGAAI